MKRPRAGRRTAREAAFSARTSTAEETQGIGERLGRVLRRAARPDQPAAILALDGPLGAGKTCFVQGLARGLEVAGPVRSPTFTLIHEHPGAVPLHHVDLYRLSAADVEGLGLEELLDAPGVVAVEWPDRAAGVLPPERLEVELAFGVRASERRLRVTAAGDRYERVVAALHRCASSP